MTSIQHRTRAFAGKYLLLGIAWCFAGAGLGSVLYAVRDTLPVDFQQFYFAGKLAGSGRISLLYHKPAYAPLVAEVQAAGVPISPIYYFNRPAFAAFLYVPFGWLPYRTAALLAILANLALLALLLWKAPAWFAISDSIGVGLFRACLLVFTPFIAAIGQGQDILLLTVIAAYSIHLVVREPGTGRAEVLAGALLAVCLIKPHLIWAAPLAALAQKRWRMLGSFLITGLLLAALSFAVIGPGGFREWVELLQAPSTDFSPAGMGNLRALGLQLGTPSAVVAALITLLCFGIVLRRGSVADQFSAAILVSLLLGPHTYRYDLSLLAVVAFLADRPAIRYLLLLPWISFYPRPDLLPIVILCVACLVGLALKALRLPRTRARREILPQPGAVAAGPDAPS